MGSDAGRSIAVSNVRYARFRDGQPGSFAQSRTLTGAKELLWGDPCLVRLGI